MPADAPHPLEAMTLGQLMRIGPSENTDAASPFYEVRTGSTFHMVMPGVWRFKGRDARSFEHTVQSRADESLANFIARCRAAID